MDGTDAAIDNLDQDDSFEEHSHRACYIFKPADLEDNEFEDEQPVKRRKLTKTPTSSDETWPKLLNGHESTAQAARRQQLFGEFWEQRQAELDQILAEVPLFELEQFVSESGTVRHDGRIPTALIVPDRRSQNQSKAIEQLKHTLNSKASTSVLIELSQRQCPNLQSALKNAIKSAITELAGVDAYAQFLNRNKHLYSLNFDLELLHLFRAQHNPDSRIILYLDSAEEFDGQTFNDLAQTLHSWSDRIPFVLLLGLTTTISLFESRLPKTTIKCLRAREFAFEAPKDLEVRLIDVFQCSNTCLGPDMIRIVHDAIALQNSTVLSITAMIKHAYMAHFYTNPLTVLLDSRLAKNAQMLERDDIEAIAKAMRNTRSFQRYVEASLSDPTQRFRSHPENLAELLESDEFLLSWVQRNIWAGRTSYLLACAMATVLTSIHSALHENQVENIDPAQRPKTRLDLYSDLYSHLDDMTQTSTFHEIEQMLTRGHSKRDRPVDLQHLSDDISQDTSNQTTSEKIMQLVLSDKVQATPTSESDDILSDLTSLEHKASTSKELKALLSKPGSSLTERLKLITLLANCDLDDHQTFSRDIFLVRPGVASTTTATFRPRIRYSIERALSTPEDYLGTYIQPDASPPPASILFSLLQEAPQTINVRDLYDAFSSRLNTAADDEEDGDEKQSKVTMALFYRALSELRMIGLVKSSSGTVVKRKGGKGGGGDVDFIAKTSWAGL